MDVYLVMAGTSSASSSSAIDPLVGASSGSSASAVADGSAVGSAVAEITDGPNHPDFWSDPADQWYGECVKTGDDAGKYHLQWSKHALGKQVRVTHNVAGSTGWAWVLRCSNGKRFVDQLRVHKCANLPCTADWRPTSGKYGNYPAPLHVQSCEPMSAVADVKAPPESIAAAGQAQPEASLPPPPLPPPPDAPAQPQVIQQVQSPPEPEKAKTLLCMQPPEPASAVALVTAPQSRRAAIAELTPDEARIQVAQAILDLAREIRRSTIYVGYRVQGLIKLIFQ